MSFVDSRRLVYFGMPVCLAVLLSIGCSDGVGLGSVQGQVTKDGQPQPKLWVRFAPAEGGRPAEAITDEQGRYELAYTGTQKGALVGRHQATILSGGELDGRGNELSPRKEILRREVEVASGSNTIDFDLSAEN